jgi:hypothetical protein
VSLYVIRRPYGWATAEELGIAAQRSRRVGDDEMPDDIRWIRSYVVREEDGSLGTFCIYDASSPEKIREHAARADLPATDIFEVVDTVVVRPDPVAAASRAVRIGGWMLPSTPERSSSVTTRCRCSRTRSTTPHRRAGAWWS